MEYDGICDVTMIDYVIWSIFSYAFPISQPSLKREFQQMSNEKNPPTFYYTGWLIGILIMVYYNPYITG